MGMNPRTLRPGSAFTPKSISGLALWLDGSDASTLYTTDAGPVTAVSSPLDVTANSCLCWYDASDASSITKDGSNLVSQWNDKSGNSRHATSSGSLRPTHGGSQNGRTVMQFTGTQGMTITGNFLQLENVTMFAVAMKNADHYSGIITSAPTNPEDSPILGFYSTTIAFINRRQVVQQAVGNGVYRLICGQAISSTLRAHFNGVRGIDTPAATALNTTNTVTKIGPFRTSDSTGLNGNIAEIVCYSGNLSEADRARVEAYLAAKWGITGVHAQAAAASDPVGYWGDKSGNGRHATQSTAANRPTLTTENIRPALTFDGVNDKLSHTLSSAIGENGITFISVARNNLTSQPSFLTTPVDASSGNSGRPITRWHGQFSNRLFVGTTLADVVSEFRGRSTRFIHALTGQRDAAGAGTHNVKEFWDGTEAASANITAPWSTASQVLAVGARDDTGVQYKGNICEVMCFGRLLTTSERARIERYLAGKWGITLAPQVSNADAQSWINRVYGNAGAVSVSTAAAVNEFCNAIDAAGLRARFYRLNLFCGTGLAACLVPLYRGPSLGGTQYGGSTDTNVNFVSGDYVESGASGGLLGNGSSKYLNTGFASNTLGQTDRHLSVFFDLSTSASNRYWFGTDQSGCGSSFWAVGSSSTSQAEFRCGIPGAGSIPTSGKIHVLVSGNGTAQSYLNGSASASVSGTAFTAPAQNIFVHALNRCNTATDFGSCRVYAYSLGTAMTAGQTSSFYSALSAFTTAMGRT